MLTYILPSYWASYLIDGDFSGLYPGEQEKIDKWLEEKHLSAPISYGNKSWFAWKNDCDNIGRDVMEYYFI